MHSNSLRSLSHKRRFQTPHKKKRAKPTTPEERFQHKIHSAGLCRTPAPSFLPKNKTSPKHRPAHRLNRIQSNHGRCWTNHTTWAPNLTQKLDVQVHTTTRRRPIDRSNRPTSRRPQAKPQPQSRHRFNILRNTPFLSFWGGAWPLFNLPSKDGRPGEAVWGWGVRELFSLLAHPPLPSL